jgi:ubiquitin C-terminal hydrolase
MNKYGDDFALADIQSEEELHRIAQQVYAPSTLSMQDTTKMDVDGSRSGANMYSLFAVIIHRGTAYHGHYFAYIRDVLGKGLSVPNLVLVSIIVAQESASTSCPWRRSRIRQNQ